jgi:MOSC domain-containing protein YiiM
MTERPHVFQINAAKEGGVPKPAQRDVQVDLEGIVGSRVAHPEDHGGPERAICLYSLERIVALQAEGHPVFPGSIGENVTTVGLNWDEIVPGIRLRIGADLLLEVTKYTSPCTTIGESFVDGHYERISQKVSPGWSRVYARVLEPGRMQIGDPLAIVE